MNSIVNFIDANAVLLNNKIFLSVLYNLIYAAKDCNNISLSLPYLSELEIPNSDYFLFLDKELSHYYYIHNVDMFMKYNPGFLSKQQHMELYSFLYYYEEKKENAFSFFFSGECISNINYVGNNKFYNISFDCSKVNNNLNIDPLIRKAFRKGHPYYVVDYINGFYIVKVLTHNPPSIMSNSNMPFFKLIGIDRTSNGTILPSYISTFTYEIPVSYIHKMSPAISTSLDLLLVDAQEELISCTYRKIDPLKLAINGGYKNTDLPLKRMDVSLLGNKIDYLCEVEEYHKKINIGTFLDNKYVKNNKKANVFLLNKLIAYNLNVSTK